MLSISSVMIAWSSPPTFRTWTQSTQRRWSASFSYPLEKKTKGKFCGTTVRHTTALKEPSFWFFEDAAIFIFTESDFLYKVLFITVLAVVGEFFSQCVKAAEPLQKVRIGYPSSAVSTLPFDIAKEKGFYPKAGLDVEYIQMRTAIAPQAILNGNINFFTSPSLAYRRLFQGYL
jgi:NMT1/THI5 like